MIHKKGKEIRPLRGDSLGKIGNGPRKNHLLIPTELARKLIARDNKGIAWSKLLK